MRMVAIITRETDLQGRENVAKLRDIFWPAVPPLLSHSRSARAGGRGRQVERHGIRRPMAVSELTSLGFDPGQVIVTDLDSDYRVHKQYFGYPHLQVS